MKLILENWNNFVNEEEVEAISEESKSLGAARSHEISEQSLKNQIATLQSLHTEELELRDQALERYRIEIEELELEYEARQEEIKDLTRIEKEIIIREFKQDKALIIQRFEETYGLRYVE